MKANARGPDDRRAVARQHQARSAVLTAHGLGSRKSFGPKHDTLGSTYTSGNILIDGISVNDFSLDYLRSSISIVNQSPSLFNDSIAKNIAYGDDSIDMIKLKEAADLSGCAEFINSVCKIN